jgi:hypothetical protein
MGEQQDEDRPTLDYQPPKAYRDASSRGRSNIDYDIAKVVGIFLVVLGLFAGAIAMSRFHAWLTVPRVWWREEEAAKSLVHSISIATLLLVPGIYYTVLAFRRWR